jgi:hypothetical protein
MEYVSFGLWDRILVVVVVWIMRGLDLLEEYVNMGGENPVDDDFEWLLDRKRLQIVVVDWMVVEELLSVALGVLQLLHLGTSVETDSLWEA